jgi:DNA-binding NtrC family response regulator
MTKPVLIVEDDPMHRRMLSRLLSNQLNLEAHEAENGREALSVMEYDRKQAIKLIIMDIEMPVMDGIETLEILRQRYPSIPVIMLTGSDAISHAVEAMKLGASDFLTKPYETQRIMITIKNALKLSLLSKEVKRLRNEQGGTFTFHDLIGHDGGLSSIVNIGRKAAASDIPVLVTGETGTGKEVFAKAIHGESARAGKSFVAVNCGAIPSQLVESTLFGHEKGAFTGATEKALGKFREADGGTIFLDEIGELPLDSQVKLLRVLQQKEVEPVGGSKTVPVNIRIVSATNRDLQTEINEGRFREDLFFRLNVLQLELTPLRDRREDIPALAHHFIDLFCSREGVMPKNMSSETARQLQASPWPGNIRQLENTINRAMVMSEGRELILDHVQGAQSTQVHRAARMLDHSLAVSLMRDGVFKTKQEIEQEAIQAALTYFNHNITRASEALGIAKSTFYKKLKL